jgi:predicted GH43/DUF377 family glycosyl hydrolase
MWRTKAVWNSIAYVHAGPDDRPLFVHRCADKFRFKTESYSTPQNFPAQAFHPQLPMEAECWAWLGDLSKSLGLGAGRTANASVPHQSVRIGLPGHFNCSLIEFQGRLLLASRQGWQNARICLSELGPDYQPLWTRPLTLAHAKAAGGAEDPRLFVHAGRLHCAFTGLEWVGQRLRTHQMVARLNDDQVEDVWLAEFDGRADWEKNWQFFEHGPHVILRHGAGTAQVAAHTSPALPWRDCHLRGGAPPVRCGDEYYHFFHAVTESHGHYEYTAGLYTFAARPPFEIRRIAAAPVLAAEAHDWPSAMNKSVIFPCGALLREGRWLLSHGYHDRECRIAAFDAGLIEEQLQPITGEA